MSPLRVVLVEPSHWHFEMYRPGIVRSGAQVVGVVDRNAGLASRIAADFGCPAWPALRGMLDATRPDFAFVFGAHVDMPAIAQALVARRIAFSLEKPGCIHSASLGRLLDAAREAALFVSVPFHYRLSSMADAMRGLAPLPSAGFRRLSFRINAGSPLRYGETSPWLTDPLAAGGGCMMNLAHHAIDFVLHCTGSSVAGVEATISNTVLGLPVEDQAHLRITLASGAIATIDTGYTHPAQADSYMGFELEVDHTEFSAARQAQSLIVRTPPSGARAIAVDWQFRKFFAHYACDALERFQQGRDPVADLNDLLATMRTVERAYATASATPGLEALQLLHGIDA